MDNAYIGEIRAVPWDWAPQDWLLCNGQELQIFQYQALFAVLGFSFGGDGTKRIFKLPDLQGRAVAGIGPVHAFAKQYGAEKVTLTLSQIPPHSHVLCAGKSKAGAGAYVKTPATNNVMGHLTGVDPAQAYTSEAAPMTALAPTSVSAAGAGKEHENRQPFLVMNYIICYSGEYPPRSD